jgi:Sigma-70, region 4
MAALVLFERLTPEQRAVFVLHEVFSFPFGKVADVIGKSEVACRQLASRARRVMEDGRPPSTWTGANGRNFGPVADAWALMHRTPPDPRR